jgi:hypothetical protein
MEPHGTRFKNCLPTYGSAFASASGTTGPSRSVSIASGLPNLMVKNKGDLSGGARQMVQEIADGGKSSGPESRDA